MVCSILPDVGNGMIDYSSAGREFNTVVTYSCDTGHNINGNSTRTCNRDGLWSGSDPTCDGK